MTPTRKPEKEPELRAIRPLPDIDPGKFEDCRERGDPMPIMFEWFKYVALLAIDIAATSPRQPGHHTRDRLHLGILRGLLNRCARLMHSTVKLASDRKGGETVALLARCIAESGTMAQWLIQKIHEQSFERYVSNAIMTDLKLKEVINSHIAERGGEALVIEERMLKSIQRVASRAGMSLEEAQTHKKLPDLFSMVRDIGYSKLMYITVQRIGSHAIHGTWTDLLSHYIEEDDDGAFTMTDNVDSVPHPNQLSMTGLLVLDAIRAHATFILDGASVLDILREHYDQVQKGILAAQSLGRGNDFDPVEDR